MSAGAVAYYVCHVEHHGCHITAFEWLIGLILWLAVSAFIWWWTK